MLSVFGAVLWHTCVCVCVMCVFSGATWICAEMRFPQSVCTAILPFGNLCVVVGVAQSTTRVGCIHTHTQTPLANTKAENFRNDLRQVGISCVVLGSLLFIGHQMYPRECHLKYTPLIVI